MPLVPDVNPESGNWPLAADLERVLEVVGPYAGTALTREPGATTVVFGVPVLHEDDALRAVRGAIEVREQMAIEPRPRIGIATGEVCFRRVDSFGSGRRCCCAPRTFRWARRILLDDATRQLVSHAVTVDSLDGDSGRDSKPWCMKPHVSRANRIRPLLAGKRSSKDSSRLASGPSPGVNRPCLSLVDRPVSVNRGSRTSC